MKNWYGVGEEGQIVTVEVRAHGWPDECDWNDPDCTDTRVSVLRAKRNEAGIVEFKAWDCPCPAEMRVCNCHNARIANYRVQDGLWVAKPDTEMVIGGVTYPYSTDNKQFAKVTAESSVTFKVTGPEIPDGAKVRVDWQGLDAAHAENPIILTFTGGESAEINLTAPLVGGVTRVRISGGYIKPTVINLRGVPV